MKEKNRLIFVLLAVFLGFSGAHSYYTGNKIKALLQFIPGIAGFLLMVLSYFLAYYILFSVALCLMLIPFVWALFDVFTVTVDADDVPMRDGSPRLGFWLPLVIDLIIPGLIILSLIVIKLIPALWVSHENTERLACAQNLNILGMSYQMFALDHSGRYPNLENKKDFDELVQKYDKRINFFICRSNSKQRYPFRWIGGYREPSPKAPIAIETLGNHKGYVNVLFADGSVKSLEYHKPTYLQLAASLREGITKEEFELLKRKFRQFDNPSASKTVPKTPAPKAKNGKKKPQPVKTEK